MRLVGWPSIWDKEQGLLPVETQEIDIHANARELRELANFFVKAAHQAEQNPKEPFELVVNFGGSKKIETTPICVTVHRV